MSTYPNEGSSIAITFEIKYLVSLIEFFRKEFSDFAKFKAMSG